MVEFMFAFIYVLSALICGISAVVSFNLGVSAIPGSFWWEFPFKQGYSVAPGLAGFAVFPLINTCLAVAVVMWTVIELGKRNMTISDLMEGKCK